MSETRSEQNETSLTRRQMTKCLDHSGLAEQRQRAGAATGLISSTIAKSASGVGVPSGAALAVVKQNTVPPLRDADELELI